MNTTQFDFVMRSAMVLCMAVGAFSFIPSLFSEVVGADIFEGFAMLAWYWVLGVLGFLLYPTESDHQTIEDKLKIIGLITACGIVAFIVLALGIAFG